VLGRAKASEPGKVLQAVWDIRGTISGWRQPSDFIGPGQADRAAV